MIDISSFVGSHLMEGFAGTRPGEAGIELLRAKAEAGEAGGIVFFSYNIEGPEQLSTLTRYIATWEVPPANRPLLLAIDQEGGGVERLAKAKGFHGWPSAAQLGRMSPQQAAAPLAGLPQELSEYGINVNFAPVLDVATGPESIIGARGRSLGGSPQRVAQLAALSLREHRRHQVVATVKHFPGLGACTGDTHEDLIDGTATWSRRELMPYEALLDTTGIDAIMSTHMVHTGLEADGQPLTFSRPIMQGILRDELGFEGVLFTDDLGMGSIERHYDVEHAVVGSLFSGHDVLVFGQNAAASSPGQPPSHRPVAGLFKRALGAVEAALAAGRLNQEALQRSDQRLRHLRDTMQR